jgi:ubiquinone/menaquinone biosynthesis C-methylase UbiE
MTESGKQRGPDTKETWRQAAAAWNRWSPAIQGSLRHATDTMLDMARLRPGDRVLDLAAGTGLQSMQIAERVGLNGYVLATDIVPEMVEFALRNIRSAGHGNIQTRVMDAQNLDVEPDSFDVVVCRHGLMLFDDPLKSLRAMRRALKPGGRVTVLVFTGPERNGFLALPASIIRQRLNLAPPPPGQPGLFTLGAPGVLAALLREAGFADVEEAVVETPFRVDSVADYVTFLQEAAGPLKAMLAGRDEKTRADVWRDVGNGLRRFETGSGCIGPGESLAAVATK